VDRQLESPSDGPEGDAGATKTVRPATVATRREIVKASAAVAGGIAAVAYVKPNLTSFGLPTALAASSGSPPPGGITSCSPNINIGNKCTLSGGIVSGTFTLTVNDGNGTCPVSAVNLVLYEGSGGGCPPTGKVANSVGLNTGGSNPLVAGSSSLCSPCNNIGPYTFSIPINGSKATSFTIYLAFQLANQGPAHDSNFWFHACVGTS
jgi:hypothetical protein